MFRARTGELSFMNAHSTIPRTAPKARRRRPSPSPSAKPSSARQWNGTLIGRILRPLGMLLGWPNLSWSVVLRGSKPSELGLRNGALCLWLTGNNRRKDHAEILHHIGRSRLSQLAHIHGSCRSRPELSLVRSRQRGRLSRGLQLFNPRTVFGVRVRTERRLRYQPASCLWPAGPSPRMEVDFVAANATRRFDVRLALPLRGVA
ncbi:hypothetical protein ACVWYI_004281 [Bradyrhizobium sp. LB13.1]